jgi:RNA polymerase sigma-70 factor (ECF subfamily)
VKLDDDLFRREAARLLATLTRAFGPANLSLAEDVVQETLARAFAAWSHHGVPEHYSAFLTAAAKNRALDVFRRERSAQRFAPELQRFIESEWTLEPTVEELFLPDALRDDQMRMMFSCCQSRLDEDVQVGLVLNVLCGFGVDEIASAFLVTPAAMKKRLQRGKATLAESKRLFDLTADDVGERLPVVQKAIYLLFNEGYHAASAEALVRMDLCDEAIRMVRLLVQHSPTATPATHALAALMCLHAARLPGRLDGAGNLRALVEQDRSTWDARLIAQGLELLGRSAAGTELSVYHLEAAIAARHVAAGRAAETRWDEIVELYDVLLRMHPSPVIALNRAMAIAEHQGPEAGLAAVRAIEDTHRLAHYPFYEAALGELALRAGNPSVAAEHFRAACRVARNDPERHFLAQRVAECERAAQG